MRRILADVRLPRMTDEEHDAHEYCHRSGQYAPDVYVPTFREKVQRVVHHVIIHPLVAFLPEPWFRRLSATVFPAYDEAPLPDGTDDNPDDPMGPWTCMWAIHHAIAHPLLVLCPPVGGWLHTWSGERLSRPLIWEKTG